MNRLTISQSIEGYLLAAQARRLSPNTLIDYKRSFRKFLEFLNDDPPMKRITQRDVEAFLACQNGISKKTLLNIHIGLSALWTWCVEEDIVDQHILHRVRRPKPEQKVIKPYKQAEIKEMLEVLVHSKMYSRPKKRACQNRLPHSERNRAIIFLLLDTGIRAEELCSIKIHETDLKNRRITVMGKGCKQRSIPFSSRTGQIIWKYMATRENDNSGDYLFVTTEGRPIDRGRLLNILTAIGERSGVVGVNVHRFRHTFAINYLRNGGDAYTLQMILGHSTMEMVKRYLALAQADLDKSHQLASPVDNWRL